MKQRLIPFVFALLIWPLQAGAETRALLVGVADYLTLDADLKGPVQDVALMAEVLAGRGVQDIEMLIGPVVPTKAAILTAMEAIAARSAPGDTVVFYFSGHGAQAPDLTGDEGGGYDELLLPADAAGWKGAIGAVENAITDDELTVWARGMLGRGVALVGILDACHSNTGFRALAAGQGVGRGLTASDLGVPDDLEPVEGVGMAPALAGDFVFLYSSQSDQRSFEYPMGEGGVWQGAFTAALAEVLRVADGASWAQVLAAASDRMVQGAVRQDPAGEGTLMQAGVFGAAAGAERFAVAKGVVQAGVLQGIEAGAVLGFYAGPVGGDALGEAVVDKAEARLSRVGAVPDGAEWAEVLVPAPVPPLALGAAVVADGADYAAWQAVLPAPATAPDLVPVLVDGGLALAGADGVLDPLGPGSSPRVVPEPGEAEADALARVLEAAGHAVRLRKLLAGVAGRSLTGKAVEVRAEARQGQQVGEGCGKVAGPKALDEGVMPCDQLWLEVGNTTGRDVDLTVLYFAADFTVVPVWPQAGLSNRVAAGERVRVGLEITPGSVPALEEVMVLAVPVEDGLAVDLTRLATPEMGRAFAGASDPVTMWIEDRMSPEDETARGFAIRPAALSMVRQVVRIVETGSGAEGAPNLTGVLR